MESISYLPETAKLMQDIVESGLIPFYYEIDHKKNNSKSTFYFNYSQLS